MVFSERGVVISGVVTRSQLRAICTNAQDMVMERGEEECPRTPTGREARIPEKLACPPAPRKRRTWSKCNSCVGAVEFFIPPDLESLFAVRVVDRVCL